MRCCRLRVVVVPWALQGEFIDADEDQLDMVLPAPGEPTGEKLLSAMYIAEADVAQAAPQQQVRDAVPVSAAGRRPRAAAAKADPSLPPKVRFIRLLQCLSLADGLHPSSIMFGLCLWCCQRPITPKQTGERLHTAEALRVDVSPPAAAAGDEAMLTSSIALQDPLASRPRIPRTPPGTSSGHSKHDEYQQPSRAAAAAGPPTREYDGYDRGGGGGGGARGAGRGGDGRVSGNQRSEDVTGSRPPHSRQPQSAYDDADYSEYKYGRGAAAPPSSAAVYDYPPPSSNHAPRQGRRAVDGARASAAVAEPRHAYDARDGYEGGIAAGGRGRARGAVATPSYDDYSGGVGGGGGGGGKGYVVGTPSGGRGSRVKAGGR